METAISFLKWNELPGLVSVVVSLTFAGAGWWLRAVFRGADGEWGSLAPVCGAAVCGSCFGGCWLAPLPSVIHSWASCEVATQLAAE